MKKLVISLVMLIGFSSPVWDAEPIKISNAPGDSLEPRVEVSATTSEIFIVWQDQRPGKSGLYFSQLHRDGTPLVSEARFSNSGSKPVLAVGTDNQVRVAWLSGDTVYFAILNENGSVIAGPTKVESKSWAPSLALGPDNEANLVYEHWELLAYYVVFTRFDASGKGPICRIELDNGDFLGDYRKQPAVCSDVYGSSLVFFTDRRGWDRTMCLGLINPAQAGKPCPLDPSQWIFCGADRVVSPTITFWPADPQEIYYFWQERFGGRDRILTLSCQPFDSSTGNAQNPKAICDSNQTATVVWQDDRDGNWEIYLAQQAAGTKIGSDVRLTSTPAQSLNPDAALLGDKPVIVWQEKEPGGFEIYLQGEFAPPPESQLKIFNPETGFWQDLRPPYANFNSALPTTVVVHGWNPSAGPFHWDGDINTNSKGEIHWTLKMARSISQKFGDHINILGWEWIKEATGDWAPGHKVSNQTILLADVLVKMFKEKNYSRTQPIHLIGHSLGAYIIAWCGSELIKSEGGNYQVAQVTLFDPPENWLAEFIASISEPISNIRTNSKNLIGIDTYIELYDGSFNSGNHGAHLFVDVPYEKFPGHSVDEWYLPTIWTEPKIYDESGKEIVGKTVGYGTIDPSKRPDPTCESYCTVKVQKTVMVQYVDWQFDEGYFKQEKDCGVCEIFEPETTAPHLIEDEEIVPNGQGVIDGSSFRFWIEKLGGKKQKEPGLSVTCSFAVIVDDWDYVSFDYRFVNPIAPVDLTFAIATESETWSVLVVSPTELFPAGNSGWLPISQLRGKTVKFIFRLESDNPDNEAIITNLTLGKAVDRDNLPPIANAGPDASYEVGPSGTIDVTLSGAASTDPEGGHLWFTWLLGESYMDDGAEITLNLTLGVYTFTLQVSDEFGKVDTDEVTITVIKPEPTVKFIRGDANRDNTINIADPVRILYFLFGHEEVTCLDACDVNDSGQLDIADPIYLLDYLFAQKAPPPVPFSEVGFDPTPDRLDCQK